MSNINRPIKTVSIIIIITIIAKFLGFLRIVFMAKFFGTGIDASAFEAAYRIPDLLFTSIGLALSTTFIPIFTEYLSTKSKAEAFIFANNIINILLVTTAIISFIGIGLAPYIVKVIYSGFHGEIYNKAVVLVRIMFPIIILIALSFTYVGILQSTGEFNIPASISIPSNIINIIYLVLFSSIWGIYGFGIAVVLGWTTQFLIQIPSLIKKGYKYSLAFSPKHEGVKKMLIMIVPIILGTSVQQINVLVNSALASRLGDNAVSALGYANYIYIIIVGVFTYALSAVVFPSLSKMHAEQDYTSFKKMLNNAIKAIILVMTPIMIGMLILSTPIIRVLLQRGKFDISSTMLTSSVLLFYSLGMIGFGIQEVLNKSFYALHDTKTPMKISVFGMILNIVLSFVFVKHFGLRGLALSASIASIFIALALLINFSRHIPHTIEEETKKLTLKVLVSSALMGIGVYFIYKVFNISSNATFIKTAVALSSAVICGIIIYGFASLAFKIPEVINLLNALLKKFRIHIKESEA